MADPTSAVRSAVSPPVVSRSIVRFLADGSSRETNGFHWALRFEGRDSFLSGGGTTNIAGQPWLGLLQSARGELAAATPNKGGHREKAMGLIDQAIGEVRAGIAFAGS